MLKANLTSEQSIQENLDTWCFEVGSDFEEMNKKAVIDYITWIGFEDVIELGCGDGASAKYFVAYGIDYTGIDINEEKLIKLPVKARVFNADILEFLKSCKSNCVPNIYTHHSLEHLVNVEEVLLEISRVLSVGGFFYGVVPANDYLHSVHHVVFESAEELIPPGCKVIQCVKQVRMDPEFKVVAQKI